MSRILVVDDDVEFVESTRALLESHGHTVWAAFNGKAGYRQAKQEVPDVILLDVMMTHDTEGFEIARRLNEDADTGEIPVIIMTGIRKARTLPFRFEPDEDWLPVKAVLEKPVEPACLLSEVERVLSNPKQEEGSW